MKQLIEVSERLRQTVEEVKPELQTGKEYDIALDYVIQSLEQNPEIVFDIECAIRQDDFIKQGNSLNTLRKYAPSTADHSERGAKTVYALTGDKELKQAFERHDLGKALIGQDIVDGGNFNDNSYNKLIATKGHAIANVILSRYLGFKGVDKLIAENHHWPDYPLADPKLNDAEKEQVITAWFVDTIDAMVNRGIYQDKQDSKESVGHIISLAPIRFKGIEQAEGIAIYLGSRAMGFKPDEIAKKEAKKPSYSDKAA